MDALRKLLLKAIVSTLAGSSLIYAVEAFTDDPSLLLIC